MAFWSGTAAFIQSAIRPLPTLISVSTAGGIISEHANTSSSRGTDSASSRHSAPFWRRSEDSSLSSGADSYAYSNASSITEFEADSGPGSVSDTAEAPAVAWSGSALATAVLGTSLWAEPGGPAHVAKAGSSTRNGSAKQTQHLDQPPLPVRGEPVTAESVAEDWQAVYERSGSAAAAPTEAAEASGNHETGSHQMAGEDIAVSPELLVRYYQLEAFAAECYAWFCRTQQHRHT